MEISVAGFYAASGAAGFRDLFSGGSYMAHVTYVPLPGCLLLDPSLYPSLALQRLKHHVGITDVAFAEGKILCKSCFPIVRPCSRACASLVRLRISTLL